MSPDKGHTQNDLREAARTFAVEGATNLRELLNLHGADAVDGVSVVLDSDHTLLTPEKFQIVYQAREALRAAVRRLMKLKV